MESGTGREGCGASSESEGEKSQEDDDASESLASACTSELSGSDLCRFDGLASRFWSSGRARFRPEGIAGDGDEEPEVGR